METYIAFLRGINVGGNAIIPMAELKTICTDIGFENVRTFIQSGNVIFGSKLGEDVLIKQLEGALYKTLQKEITVVIRTAKELSSMVTRNPFPDAKPSLVGVVLLTTPIPKDAFKSVIAPGGEEIEISEREIYIYYPTGMGSSKLKLPKTAQNGTVRNINTITKIEALCQGK
jgi:uncharacterized protein (DUF1697 family)